MKRHSVGLLLLAGLTLACGCSTPSKSVVPPTVELAGTTNAPVSGYYIAKGERHDLSGVLPLTLTAPGLSQLAVRKVNSEDTLTLTARTQNGTASQTVRANLDEGVRVTLDDLALSSIPPQESLNALPEGVQLTLQPYWENNTWVFDDTVRGLSHEPFVKGAPELLSLLVKDIPDAREGFHLICSTKPFKGFQKRLLWVRAEAGGNVYRLDDKENKSLQGWLCPAMFRYFSETPKTLYLKAESRKG